MQKLAETSECFREISYETQISTAMWPTDNYWVCCIYCNHSKKYVGVHFKKTCIKNPGSKPLHEFSV
jgi:hypothetical protein